MGLRSRLAARGLPTAKLAIKAQAGHSETVAAAALPADAFDALVAAHPPTDAQTVDGLSFNPDTFVPALLAACVDLGVPWTEQDWEEQMRAAASAGELPELIDLFTAVYDLNRRIPPTR